MQATVTGQPKEATAMIHTYDYMTTAQANAHTVAYALRRLGLSDIAELEAIASDSHDHVKRVGYASDAAADVYAMMEELHANAATHSVSLNKSVRAADSVTMVAELELAQFENHAGRCAALFVHALEELRRTHFLSFHPGAAKVGRPVDRDVVLSATTALAPILRGESDTAVWEFEHATAQGIARRVKAILSENGYSVDRRSVRIVNEWNDDRSAVLSATVTVKR